jgi:GR25 family glycosyltransferase involved in LPS biosynthesis
MPDFDIYFINLDRRIDRLKSLENDFNLYLDNKIQVTRVSGVDAAGNNLLKSEDLISNAEKACYTSHIKAIECSLQSNTHSLIIEDDVCFSNHTQQILSSILCSKLMEGVDICFAELGLENMTQYPPLFALKNKLSLQNKASLIDLDHYRFHGATAYIINQHSKKKLLDLIQGKSSLNQPYDEDISQWVREGKIIAKCILPFPITLNPLEFSSDIRNDRTHFYTNIRLAIRRVLGVDYDHTMPIDEQFNSFYEQHFNPRYDHFLRLINLAYSSEFDSF